MQQLQRTPAASTGEAVTMTSLELVEFINSQRGDGESELRHDHFMAKVPKVLGEEHAPKFRDMISVTVGNGAIRQSPIYRFPKREACLMAMSYSYDLQAKVFDRMTALEEAAQKAPMPIAAVSPVPMLADSVDRGLISRRTAQGRLDAWLFSQFPGMQEAMAAKRRQKPASSPVVPAAPVQVLLPLPAPAKATRKPRADAPKPKPITVGKLPFGGLDGCNFIVEEIAPYVVGGAREIRRAMRDFGLVNETGVPTTKGRGLVTRKGVHGYHWKVADLLWFLSGRE